MTPAESPPQSTCAEQTCRIARSPWLWIPSLYFSQGVPYVIVMTMSVVMYKRLGLSNTDIAFYSSLLGLPWVIKPLWSPLVDITRTKRFWVVAMQFLVSLGLALVAFSVRGRSFLTCSLLLFGLMALASATHDIAADGFYMLSLSKHEQAWWVGLRSTFYRTAMVVGSGLLVVLAGVLEGKNGLPPLEIPVRAEIGPSPGGTTDNSPTFQRWDGITGMQSSPGGTAETLPASPRSSSAVPSGLEDSPVPVPNVETLGYSRKSLRDSGQTSPLQILAQPAHLEILTAPLSAGEAMAIIDRAAAWNQEHGFLQKPAVTNGAPNHSSLRSLLAPLETFLRVHFPKPVPSQPHAAGNVGVIQLTLSQPPAEGQDIVVTLDRPKKGLEYFGLGAGDRGFRLVGGERFVFDSHNWNQPALAVIQLDPNLKTDAAITFLATSGNIPAAWSITLLIVAALFLAFSCWHSLMLPRPASDGPVVTHRSLAGEFLATLGSFFKKPGVLLAVAFILLYRFDEAQLSKLISPFLLDDRAGGGLGLTTSQLGLAYGTFGILALTCGGLLGGFLGARFGLKRMLPVMVCSMYLPKLAFVFLSYAQPENFLATCGVIAVEQFGYGFGFTAFMLYLLYFAEGPHKTAHYAICTGFMALGMMIPGLWSGWLADLIGYRHFFVWVIGSALPGFILAMLLKIDPEFGKRI